MAKDFIAKPYQGHIIGHELDTPRAAVWAGMGMGKTSSTLTALDTLELVDPGPALVLAPLRVAQSTWPDEVAKWNHLRNIEVVPIIGTPQERRAALKQPGNVFTINYENLPWLLETVGKDWPFRKVVADEATRLKAWRGSYQRHYKTGKVFLRATTGRRSTALARVAHNKVKYLWELTGTPSPNGLKDLWAQAWFLDAGKRLGSTFDAFKQRWFSTDFDGYGLKPHPFAQEQIQDRLRDLCLSLDAKDWFDIKEPIVNVVRVDLPSKARRLYENMQKEMFMEIAGKGIEAVNAAVKTMKCLQLASGSVWVDRETEQWADVHDGKLQALESIQEEAAGMPLLVRYHWVPSRERILKAFPKARMLDDDPQTIRDWNAGKIPLLVAHAQSCGHGLNLQDGGNVYVEFDGWWDLEHYQQITERIGPTRQAQSGHDRPVFHYHIVANGTLDDLVMSRLEGKRSVQDLLLEFMKRG